MTPFDDLPLEEQNEAIIELVSTAIRQMPRATILEIRGEIVEQFPADIPIVATTLQLIDGHLSLRDMDLVPEPPATPLP